MKWRAEWVVVPLMILAAFFYMNLDGLPLDVPSNIKAADPFYHTIIVDTIVDSEQWNYHPSWLALGETTGVNVSPPILYMQAAVLSLFASIPTWASIYFLVCLFAALAVGFGYFLVKRVFNDTLTAVLAVFAFVLPLRPHAWLYQIYIGLWIQVVAFAFVIAFVWMAVSYLQDRKQWQLWMANACVVVIMLAHPQDLLPVFPLWLVVAYTIVRHERQTWLANTVALTSASLVTFISLLPRFLYVWSSRSGSFAIQLFNPRPDYFGTGYSGGLVLPELSFFPVYVLALAGLGLIAMLPRWRTFKFWLVLTAAFLVYTYVTPFIFKDPYYVLRMRALAPYVVLPSAALLITSAIRTVKAPRAVQWIAVFVIGIITLGAGYMAYAPLQQNLQGSIISPPIWHSYSWIRESTPQESTVVFVEGGADQAMGIMTKRQAAAVTPQDLVARVQQFTENTTTLTDWNVGWMGHTLRDSYSKQTGFLSFETYDEAPTSVALNNFDYVYFQNLNEQVAQVNGVIAQELISHNYTAQYNQNGILILGRRA